MVIKETIEIVIADSQYLIIEALKAIFNGHKRYKLIATANSADELSEMLQINQPDILITDFLNLDFDSIQSLQMLKQKFPEMGILILTNTVNKNDFSDLNRVGIKNIITKVIDNEGLFEAIEATHKGKKHYSSDILDLLIDIQERKAVSNEPAQLTSSEIEIVRLISEGLTTKEIAHRKNISFHTVMTHRKNIFRKLGINNAPELLMYAMKAGLIDNLEYYI
jgi:DNA-binding NarL/FixJ family response regulator